MFTGFTPETIDFLWGIRMNNNRDWFLEHKKQYVSTLYEPMKALGKDLFAPFMEIPGTILKVSRIYRDARLHHPDPYKESLWLCIRQDVEWWAENPCLFFEINPEGVSYGFTLWHPRTAAMEEFRKYISAYPDEFLHLISQTEAAVGQPVTAQLYKRPKETDNPALAPYFAWKGGIECIRHKDVGDEMFGAELENEVADFFAKLTPLYTYFTRFGGVKRRFRQNFEVDFMKVYYMNGAGNDFMVIDARGLTLDYPALARKCCAITGRTGSWPRTSPIRRISGCIFTIPTAPGESVRQRRPVHLPVRP